ncbi:hypothetical protein ACHAWF_002651, partial [Thalassiosira exigua]
SNDIGQPVAMPSLCQIIHRLSAVAVATRVPATQINLPTVAAFAPGALNAPAYGTRRAYARPTGPLFSSPPTRYLLSYDYIPDVLEKRGPHREGHIGLAKEMIEDGTCVSGGPTLVPGEGVPNGGEWMTKSMPDREDTRSHEFTHVSLTWNAALFVFTTKDAAEKFVAEDPYVSNGIVTGHSIAEWSVVVGSN